MANKGRKDIQSRTGYDDIGSDDVDERGNWLGKLDFFMSCISFAVGLGNIWRFPYLCYRNGGAVFLIPYLFFLAFSGMPLYFAEVAFGQFASLSSITIWRISPLFKGIGYGMVFVSAIASMYYNVIISWAVYYLVNSFRAELPWSTCDNEWNTDQCVAAVPRDHHKNATHSSVYDPSQPANLSSSLTTTAATRPQRSSSEEFWEYQVLQRTGGIDELGGMRWELLAALAFTWIVVFLCLVKGIKSSGRAVYITGTFPYLVLTILLIRGVTLPGAIDGIKFYFNPLDIQLEKLLNLRVWGEAAMQIFYSLGPCWGGLITMASYNKFDNDVYRDARILPLCGSATSIFAGFVCFSVMGFLAHETGLPIEEVVNQGPGLAFVTYPAAVSRLPFSQIWAILLFFMFFLVGIGTQIATFQTVSYAFIDEFDWLKNKKMLFTAFICFFEFVMGIPCVTKGGVYYLQIVDWYSCTFPFMTFAFIELFVISWVYGVDRFSKDIEFMIGYSPCSFWKILWRFIAPTLIVFVFLFSVINHTAVTYGTYIYPSWAIVLGWMIAAVSIVPLPVHACIELLRAEGTLLQRMRTLLRPSSEWGPAAEKDRARYHDFLAHCSTQPATHSLTANVCHDHIENNEKTFSPV